MELFKLFGTIVIRSKEAEEGLDKTSEKAKKTKEDTEGLGDEAERTETSDELKILYAEDLTQSTIAPIEAESQENLLQTVRDYFTARYNFKGSYSENEEEIIKAVKPLVTDDFLESVEKSIEDSKKHNGTEREMKDYQCEVLKIYRNGYSENEMKSKGIQPSYFCLVKINGRNTLYRIKMEYAEGNYLIRSQEMLGTEQEAKKDVG